MAKSIQDLRRERGFRSSKEFADALGVSPSSMSRYDRDATLIPVKVAWAMADLLECSIDEVLGRKYVTSGRSELQEDYDSLSPKTQALVREFMEFAKAKDKKERRIAQAQQDLKFDWICQLYERLFYQSLYDESDSSDPAIFASSDQEREAFKEFVIRKTAEKRRERVAKTGKESTEEALMQLEKMDEEVIHAIMLAYDRRHSMTIEYMGGLP